MKYYECFVDYSNEEFYQYFTECMQTGELNTFAICEALRRLYEPNNNKNKDDVTYLD